MSKIIITYIFTLIILVSITTPTYMHFSDINYETSKVIDHAEEEENKSKESSEDLEIKIYYSHHNESLDVGLQKKLSLRFYSKNYSSYFKKLVAPPPEFTFNVSA